MKEHFFDISTSRPCDEGKENLKPFVEKSEYDKLQAQFEKADKTQRELLRAVVNLLDYTNSIVDFVVKANNQDRPRLDARFPLGK